MNFDFNNEQRVLRDQARQFLSTHCSPKSVRSILEGEQLYDSNLWSAINELGWSGALIPESYGGGGFSYIDMCLVCEELGRAIAPVPFSSSILLAAEIIAAVGSEQQKLTYLPRFATGEIIGTLALAEGLTPINQKHFQVECKNDHLTGVKLPVPDGSIADVAVVAAKGIEGPALYIVNLSDSRVRQQLLSTIDPSRSHASLTFHSAPCEPVGNPKESMNILESVIDRAAVMISFEQLGGAQACLDMAVAYSKNRLAFGRPVGSFQAIKHKLAKVYITIELARSNAYFGAWALQSSARDLPSAAAASRVACSNAYNYAAQENIQTHGGVGFTWEFDCHLHHRRARLLAQTLGSERSWKEHLLNRIKCPDRKQSKLIA